MTRIAGVMGWPVHHSLSPRLHGFWLRELGIKGQYLPLAVQPQNLQRALRALPVLGFMGANITVPHKEHTMDLIDAVDDIALRVGAINTVTVRKDGSLSGTNTDAFGFIESLRSGAPGWQPSRPVLLLGAGGAARAVCVGLLEAGATEIRICNRTRSRCDTLVREIEGNLYPVDWDEREAAMKEVGLLVNTTTLGMRGAAPLSIGLNMLPMDAVVADIVYAPLETELLEAARLRGNLVVDGLGMLLYQAVPGFTSWFGREPEVSAELRTHVLSE